MSRTVYVNIYHDRYYDDGFEVGDAYTSEVEANRNAHDDARLSWKIHRVDKVELHL